MEDEDAESASDDEKRQMLTILIVDDEPLIRMNLSDFLQECGFKVLEASNAAEAISMIESNQSLIDVVFTDIRMPGELDGIGLAKWIRSNRKDVQVILASGDATKADIAKELCDDQHFFAKPYDLDLVLSHIKETIAARDSLR